MSGFLIITGAAQFLSRSRSRIQRIESGRGYVVLTEDLAARISAATGVSSETLFSMGPGGCS